MATPADPLPAPTGVPARLAAALRAAERGWPVFPIYPYSKCPAVTDWETRATCDPGEIRRWWAQLPYNVGIACQPAGIVVLDLDAAHGQRPPTPWDQLGVTHGRDVLRILAERAGQPDPIDTYCVASPTAGEHRYFLAPADRELRNTTGDTGTGLGWRIDTRAAGGAIIAAGSVRRINGRPRPYRVIRDHDPIALPPWLLTALTPPPRPPHTPTPIPTTGQRIDAYVQAALQGETTTVTQATPGTRAHTVFRAAARLGELVGAGVLDEATARNTLLAAAASLDTPTDRFTRREAERHVTNGIVRGLRNPRPLRSEPPAEQL